MAACVLVGCAVHLDPRGLDENEALDPLAISVHERSTTRLCRTPR